MVAENNIAIEKKIKSTIASQCGVEIETLNNDTRFVEDLSIDSLDLVELIMTLEEEFGIEIPDEDSEKLKTVSSVIDYVSKKVKPE